MASQQTAENARDENTLRMYRALDTSMMTAHRRDDDASRADAERTARILLAYPDLPLIIRARACMILGCSEERDFLDWAKEGVRIAELAISVASEVGRVERELLISCQSVLDEAQKAFDEAGGEEALEQQLVDEQEGDQDDPDDDIEVVWQADPADLEASAGASKRDSGSAGAAATADVAKGKK